MKWRPNLKYAVNFIAIKIGPPPSHICSIAKFGEDMLST